MISIVGNFFALFIHNCFFLNIFGVCGGGSVIKIISITLQQHHNYDWFSICIRGKKKKNINLPCSCRFCCTFARYSVSSSINLCNFPINCANCFSIAKCGSDWWWRTIRFLLFQCCFVELVIAHKVK